MQTLNEHYRCPRFTKFTDAQADCIDQLALERGTTVSALLREAALVVFKLPLAGSKSVNRGKAETARADIAV